MVRLTPDVSPPPAALGSGVVQSAPSTGFLDGLRGLAALYVAVGHARWLLWEGYAASRQHLAHDSAMSRAIGLALASFRYGHQVVLFFFVLSGLVIHRRYATRFVTHPGARFDWLPFLRRRARRLYPPLVLAIVLTYVLDVAGQRLGYAIYFGRTLNSTINQNVGADHSLKALLGNLGFLMNPVWGSDGPLWSLKFEWWFYVFYPLLWLGARRSPWRVLGALALLFVLSLWGDWPSRLLQDICSAYVVWWLGAILAERLSGRLRYSWGLASLPALLLIPLPIVAPTASVIGDLAWGLGFFGSIAFMFALKERGFHLGVLERLRSLGDMSYTLYVAHFPILVLMSGWLMSRSTTGALPVDYTWVALGMIVVVAVSYAAHFAVERPFLSRRALSPVTQSVTSRVESPRRNLARRSPTA